MRKLFVAAAIVLAFGVGQASAAPVFDFANVTGALFRFDGATNSFTFPNGVGGVDFLVTSQNAEWPGSVLNYTGDFVAPAGGWVVAPTGNPAVVTGTGTLVLRNAANTATLTGDLVWQTIGTFFTVGGLNVAGVLNYTNLTLVGADANLASLASSGGASVVVSFQNIAVTQGAAVGNEECSGLLGQLRCGGVSTGSYSGTLSAVPVPEPGSSMLFFSISLVGFAGVALRRQRK
jgi:hypothetical protein